MKREASVHVIRRSSTESARVIAWVGETGAATVADMAERVEACLRAGGRFLTCGNGGSAADAQHIAAELSGKFYLRRPGLAAVALTVNTSALTAIGNDFSFDEVFSRQMDGLAREGDVLLAITTSGGSANVNAAVAKAREIGVTVLGFTGSRGSDFARSCDVALVVPSEDTPRIQEGHIFAGHMLCQLVEASLFGSEA